MLQVYTNFNYHNSFNVTKPLTHEADNIIARKNGQAFIAHNNIEETT